MGLFAPGKTPPEPSAALAHGAKPCSETSLALQHGAKPWTTARNDPRTVRNRVRSPRWRFLRRRMPFRAVVHGFYAVGTHFALLVGGFYAVGTHSESSSAPSTPLALTPETSAKISTMLAQVTPGMPGTPMYTTSKSAGKSLGLCLPIMLNQHPKRHKICLKRYDFEEFFVPLHPQ